MKNPRLLLADDHTILVEGLKALLAPEFDVVATAGDGRAVLEAAEAHRPDLILLDISMPGLNGIEAARRLKQSNPGAKLIILTMHADLSFVSAAGGRHSAASCGLPYGPCRCSRRIPAGASAFAAGQLRKRRPAGTGNCQDHPGDAGGNRRHHPVASQLLYEQVSPAGD